MEGRLQQMTWRNPAAIGDGIEITFSPVPGGMEAYGEPKIAGAAKRQAEEKSNHRSTQDARPGLAGIAEMKSAKSDRKKNRTRPETNHLSQGELGVATHEELFVEADQEKEHSPKRGELQDARSVQRKCSKIESAGAAQCKHKYRDCRDSPQQTNPE